MRRFGTCRPCRTWPYRRHHRTDPLYRALRWRCAGDSRWPGGGAHQGRADRDCVLRHLERNPQLRLSQGHGRRSATATDPRDCRLHRGIQLGRHPRHVRCRSPRRHAANPLRSHLSAAVREARLKIAIFSDIHANWQALEAVLRDCPPTDETLCLGDVVGYGGDPKRCIDEVTRRGWLTLVGNHDRACTDPEILEWVNDDAAAVVRWTVDTIGEDRIAWLRGLPDSHVERDVLLVHASPRDHIYDYVIDSSAAVTNVKSSHCGDRVPP